MASVTDDQQATTASASSGIITQTASYLPLALIDKCIGSRIWVIMKNDKELVIYTKTCLK